MELTLVDHRLSDLWILAPDRALSFRKPCMLFGGWLFFLGVEFSILGSGGCPVSY